MCCVIHSMALELNILLQALLMTAIHDQAEALCKVLEKIIHRHLYTLLKSNNVLCDSQYGFRIKSSTTALLMTAIHDQAEALNNCLSTHCVLIDFAKAFDSVLHDMAVA